MPTKNEYVVMTDIESIAMKLARKFPDKYGHIPIERIKFYAMVNKEKPNAKSKAYTFTFLPEPIAQEIFIDAVCIVYLTNWASLQDKNRVLIVASALSSLEFDGDHIKSKGYDVKENREIIELFGVDYENSPDVPDILGMEQI